MNATEEELDQKRENINKTNESKTLFQEARNCKTQPNKGGKYIWAMRGSDEHEYKMYIKDQGFSECLNKRDKSTY